MRRPLVAGNWKMHGTCTSVEQLLDELIAHALPPTVLILQCFQTLFICRLRELRWLQLL